MRAYLLTTTATLALFAATSTHAQTNWTGAVSSDWFDAGNWIGGVPTGATNANINTVLPRPTVVASPGGTADTLSVGLNGTGSLTIQSGGTVTDIFGVIGVLPGSQGTATVTGAGSTWTNISGGIVVGGLGTGTLTVENGGTVNSSGASVGLAVGSTGAVTVTGPGSSWNNTALAAGLNIGSFGRGTLTISNGGTVINSTPFTANIGNGVGSQGTVLVTGAGSTWTNSSGVNVGILGTGTLTVANGGTVTSAGGAC